MPLRVKNIKAGFYDGQGRFHPIRAASDYDPDRVGESERWLDPPDPTELKAISAQADFIAKESRKMRAAKKRKAAKAAKKKAARKTTKGKKKAAAKKAVVSAKEAAKAVKKRKNPIPLDRYVHARVKRTRSGDIKIMLPLR